MAGLTSTATRTALGTNSCRSASRFAANSLEKKLIPVRLPPGRARLATRPSLTGSSPTPKTIGIVVVAALAASAAWLPASVAITATRRRTKSAASAGRRSNWPSSQWYSIVTFCALDVAGFVEALAKRGAARARRTTRRLADEIRSPASPAAAPAPRPATPAAPPSSVMNSRRLIIRSPRRRGRAASAAHRGRVPSRS